MPPTLETQLELELVLVRLLLCRLFEGSGMREAAQLSVYCFAVYMKAGGMCGACVSVYEGRRNVRSVCVSE